MSFKKLTANEITKADNASIIDYINTLGIKSKKAGKTLKIEGYGGLYIDPVGNRWNCFSQGKGGGPIQFVMFMENKSWIEAVKTILDKTQSDQIKPEFSRPTQPEVKEFNLPKKNNTYRHIIAYLIQTRGINKNIVYKFIKNKTLYEDEKRNCVFVGYDKGSIPRYAGLRGTNTNIPFKGEVEGSNKAYSFNLKGESNRLFVFESPIELMSYKTLKDGSTEFNHHMLSLGCLADVALEQYLIDNPNITNITLCLNNDKWGIKATQKIKEKYKDKNYDINTQLPRLKDYNDVLLFYRAEKKQRESPKKEIEDEWDMEL